MQKHFQLFNTFLHQNPICYICPQQLSALVLHHQTQSGSLQLFVVAYVTLNLAIYNSPFQFSYTLTGSLQPSVLVLYHTQSGSLHLFRYYIRPSLPFYTSLFQFYVMLSLAHYISPFQSYFRLSLTFLCLSSSVLPFYFFPVQSYPIISRNIFRELLLN